MIGHYLLTLTEEQEDRVLTGRMGKAGQYMRRDGCRCVVGLVHNVGAPNTWIESRHLLFWENDWNYRRIPGVGARFDDLCERFGESRIADAVRNRIWANRARRVLGHALVSAGAP